MKMIYKEVLYEAGKDLLCAVGGAILFATLGKIGGELTECSGLSADATRYVLDLFGVQGDIGNIFALSGAMYGPMVTGLFLEKKQKLQEKEDRINELEKALDKEEGLNLLHKFLGSEDS